MMASIRRWFPLFGLALLVAALAYSASFPPLPQADFAFNNGTEVKTVDPALATGEPEGRLIDAVFEGLMRIAPDESLGVDAYGNVRTASRPAAAESMEISEDQKTYTFKMRKDAKWTDNDPKTPDEPVTADDFLYSWRRLLMPRTASEYSYQLYYVRGAKAYNSGELTVGKRVELFFKEPSDSKIKDGGDPKKFGVLKKIEEPANGKSPERTIDSQTPADKATHTPSQQAVLTIDIDGEGEQRFSLSSDAGVEKCEAILPEFASTVAIKAPDPHTFIFELNYPTPYFKELLAFYPLYPVNRKCVQENGSPKWTHVDKIVSNGPFKIEFRRLRDRIRLRKNESYWGVDKIKLNVVDVMVIGNEVTALNMYVNGQIDWTNYVPLSVIDDLKKMKPDWRAAPMMAIYFLRLNTTTDGLKDKRIRHAINMAIDKKAITEKVVKAGQIPARGFVPPLFAEYDAPQGDEFNPAKARELLAEAGFPNGEGLPKLRIQFNALGFHQQIAEVVQQHLMQNLGIQVELQSLEWGTFLNNQSQMTYNISRAGWTADYPDPNTFLDMWVTDGPNNQTGFSNKQYDELIEKAKEELDPKKRMALFREAETILLDEQPIVPIYYYTSVNIVKPRVKGWYPCDRNVHSLTTISVSDDIPAGSKP
jgi:oligopeptide transport system substrate-binding protein